MKLGTDEPSFILKPKIEGHTLSSHVTADVSTFWGNLFFQKIYTIYISFDSEFYANKILQ